MGRDTGLNDKERPCPHPKVGQGVYFVTYDDGMGTVNAAKVDEITERVTLAGAIGPVALAVVIFAGQLKNNPVFAWLPVDLTLIAAAAVGLATFARRTRRGPGTGRAWPALALWTVFLLGVAGASFNDYSQSKVLVLFTVTLLLVLAPSQLLATAQQRNAFLLSLVAIGAFVGASVFLGNDPAAADVTARAIGDNRVLVEGSNTIGTAQMAGAAALVCLLSALLTKRRAATRLALVAFGAVLVYVAVATGSRGPVLAAAVALVGAAVLAPRLRRIRGRSLILTALTAVAAVWYASRSDSYGLDRITDLLSGQVDASAAQRQYFWAISLDQIRSHPLGLGWGDFGSLTWLARYPHNAVVEAALEGGWVAGIGLVSLIVVSLIVLQRNATSAQNVLFLGLVAFATFNAMVSSDLNGNRLMWVTLGYALTLLPGRQPRSDGTPDAAVGRGLLDVKRRPGTAVRS